MRLAHGEITLEPTSGSAEFEGFSIVVDGKRQGTVAFRDEGRRTRSVRWNAGADREAIGLVVRVLELCLAHAFANGTTRLEARIPRDRATDLRAASIAGLRREGIVRGHGGEPDRVLMARLIDDPPITSPEGFIAILNAGLPTKRVIGQGILRDPDGRVLLCELTYKTEWDLPGGVIEVGESPAIGLEREIEEELGVDVTVGEFVTVNWLPPWRGWDDACVFVFDLGVEAAEITERMKLQPTEIAAVHWATPDEVRRHATAATVELLQTITAGGFPSYRDAPRAAE
jgi:8-oxo-dGTP pyrophosphatase MutT (NUDIX family)